MTRRTVLSFLLLATLIAAEEADTWLAELGAAEPGKRRAAQRRLQTTQPQWSAIVRELRTGSAETRRALRRHVRRRLYYAPASEMNQWIGHLLEEPDLGRSFVGDLARLAESSGGSSARGAARVAAMKLLGTRTYVRAMAESPDDHDALRQFAPGEADRLIYAAGLARNANEPGVGAYVPKLFAGDPEAEALLLGGVAETSGAWANHALELLLRGPISEAAGEIVALRVSNTSSGDLDHLCRTLLRRPWPPSLTRALAPTVCARLEGDEKTRLGLGALVVRLRGIARAQGMKGDDAVKAAVQKLEQTIAREAKQDGLVGYSVRLASAPDDAARKALHSEFAKWPESERVSALATLARFDVEPCGALVAERLQHGTDNEAGAILAHLEVRDERITARLVQLVLEKNRLGAQALERLVAMDRAVANASLRKLLRSAVAGAYGADVRSGAIASCRNLTSLPAPVVAELVKLFDKDVTLDHAALLELKSTADWLAQSGPRACLPLFVRLAQGRAPKAFTRQYLSASTMRLPFLKAAIATDVRHPSLRPALQLALQGDLRSLRQTALTAYLRVTDPDATDRRAMHQLLSSRSGVERRVATRLIARWKR